MLTVNEGNKTHDRVCTCDLQSGYYSIERVHYNPDFCVYHHCTNGSVLAFNGMCYTTWLHMCAVLQDMITHMRCVTRHGYTCALCYKTWLHVHCVTSHGYTCTVASMCYKTWLHTCTVLQDIVTHVHCVTRHCYTCALCYKTLLHVCTVLQDIAVSYTHLTLPTKRIV